MLLPEQGGSDSPGLYFAVSACLLQLALTEPASLHKQFQCSSSLWQSLFSLLLSSPWQHSWLPLSAQASLGESVALEPCAAALSQQHFFISSLSRPVVQMAPSQPAKKSSYDPSGLLGQQPQQGQQQSPADGPVCAPYDSKQQARGECAESEPFDMQHAAEHFRMVVSISKTISAVATSLNDSCPKDNADNPGSPCDISTGLDNHTERQQAADFQKLSGPVLEALMAALSAAAATCLHLHGDSHSAAGPSSFTLMQAIRQKHQTTALCQQAEHAVAACCEAAAALLASMPSLLPSQIVFAVTSCEPSPRPWQQAQDRLHPALNSRFQGPQSSQPAFPELPQQMPAHHSNHCSLAQVHNGHRQQNAAHAPSGEDGRLCVAQGSGATPEDQEDAASENVLGLVGSMLLNGQDCSHATQMALCRLVTNLLTTQGMADALLYTHQGAAANSHFSYQLCDQMCCTCRNQLMTVGHCILLVHGT